MRPWGPFRDLEQLERHFEDVFGRPLLPGLARRLAGEGRPWAPPIEVLEKEDSFVVQAELPGMKREDIDISVVGDTLTIKGERKPESGIKEEHYHICERYYGAFLRSIALPSEVDTTRIEAIYEDGILKIVLHKASEAKPKRIEIKVK